jgi:hypothetical protein
MYPRIYFSERHKRGPQQVALFNASSHGSNKNARVFELTILKKVAKNIALICLPRVLSREIVN